MKGKRREGKKRLSCYGVVCAEPTAGLRRVFRTKTPASATTAATSAPMS